MVLFLMEASALARVHSEPNRSPHPANCEECDEKRLLLEHSHSRLCESVLVRGCVVHLPIQQFIKGDRNASGRQQSIREEMMNYPYEDDG